MRVSSTHSPVWSPRRPLGCIRRREEEWKLLIELGDAAWPPSPLKFTKWVQHHPRCADADSLSICINHLERNAMWQLCINYVNYVKIRAHKERYTLWICKRWNTRGRVECVAVAKAAVPTIHKQRPLFTFLIRGLFLSTIHVKNFSDNQERV